jgi:hypothetical protein
MMCADQAKQHTLARDLGREIRSLEGPRLTPPFAARLLADQRAQQGCHRVVRPRPPQVPG